MTNMIEKDAEAIMAAALAMMPALMATPANARLVSTREGVMVHPKRGEPYLIPHKSALSHNPGEEG